MCSSDNTVQLGVVAEGGLMMFTHHSSALSGQDALKIHSHTHTHTYTDTGILYVAKPRVFH